MSEDWLEKLVEQTSKTQNRVDSIESDGPRAMEELRSVVKQNAEYLNHKLHNGQEVLRVSDLEGLSFSVTDAYSGLKSEAQLLKDIEMLELHWPPLTGGERFPVRPQDDRVVFGQGIANVTEISLDYLSRRLLESLVKARHRSR